MMSRSPLRLPSLWPHLRVLIRRIIAMLLVISIVEQNMAWAVIRVDQAGDDGSHHASLHRPLTIEGVVESNQFKPMVMTHEGGFKVKGAEFVGIPALTLIAGDLFEEDEFCHTSDDAIEIDGTLMAPQEDLGALRLSAGRVRIEGSNLSPSEHVHIQTGGQLYDLTLNRGKKVKGGHSRPLTPAVFVGSESTLRSRSIRLESFDEGAEIRASGFIHSTDESITIEAEGDVYVGHLFSNKNLYIRTSGHVFFEKDVFVTGDTHILARNVSFGQWQSGGSLHMTSLGQIRFQGTMTAAGGATLLAHDDIRIEGAVDIHGHSVFQSTHGHIINTSKNLRLRGILKAAEIKNYGLLDVTGELQTFGQLVNSKRGGIIRARSLDDLKSFKAILKHNQGTIEITDDAVISKGLQVKRTLRFNGTVAFDKGLVSIDSGSTLVAGKGVRFQSGDVKNNGTFMVEDGSFEGTVKGLHNTSTGRIHIKGIQSLAVQDYTNEGTVICLGSQKITAANSFKDSGHVFSPTLFVVRAKNVHFAKGHRSELRDGVVVATEAVRADSEASFHFEGADMFLSLRGGKKILFHGRLSHDSTQSTRITNYLELTGNAKPTRRVLNATEDAFQAYRLQNEAWASEREQVVGHLGGSSVVLYAPEEVDCMGASIQPQCGDVSLISQNTINTKGAQIKSGYFRGDHLAAQARHIHVESTEMESFLGRLSVVGHESVRLQDAQLEGGAGADVRGGVVDAQSSSVTSRKGRANLTAQRFSRLESLEVDGLQGSTLRSDTAIEGHNVTLGGADNQVMAPRVKLKELKTQGRTLIQAAKATLENLDSGGTTEVVADQAEIKGAVTGANVSVKADELTNTARIELKNRLQFIARVLRQMNKTRAAHSTFVATERYEDAATSVNEALERLELIAENNRTFHGQQVSEGSLRVHSHHMPLLDILAKVQARSIEAILGDQDVVLERNMHLLSDLTVVAKSLTNLGDLTSAGSFTGHFHHFFDNQVRVAAGGAVSVHAGERMDTGQVQSGEDVQLHSDNALTITHLIEGQNVAIEGAEVECVPTVRRVYYPGGYRDVIDSPVGAIARHGNLSIEGYRWLVARAATFQSDGGYVFAAAPRLYLGSQVLEEDHTTSSGRTRIHTHDAVHERTLIKGDKGIIITTGVRGEGDPSAQITLEGVEAHSGGKTVVHSAGTLHNRAVHDRHTRETTEKSGSGGLFGRTRTVTTTDETVDSRSNTFVSEDDVQFTAVGDNVHDAPDVTTKGKLRIISTDGKIILASTKSSHMHSRQEEDSNAVWQTQISEGRYDETVNVGHILAGKGIELKALRGIEADFGGDSLTDAIESYRQNPATRWLADVAEAHPDINWSRVTAVHEDWHEEHSGLTGPAAIVLSLAVTVATGGMGATLTGLTGMAGSMASAGFSALASQAAVSFVNNKGDMGAVFQDLTSKDFVKSMAITIASAGILHEVSEFFGLPAEAQGFKEHFQDSLARSGVSAGVSMVADSEHAGNILEEAARGLVAGTVGGIFANIIGKNWASGDLKFFGHKMAHGALGACLGAVTSRDPAKGALAGAIGGIVSECLGEMITGKNQHIEALDKEIKQAHAEGRPVTKDSYMRAVQKDLQNNAKIAKVGAAVAAFAMRQDPSTAHFTARNAVDNNLVPALFLAAAPVGEMIAASGATLVTALVMEYYSRPEVQKQFASSVRYVQEKLGLMMDQADDTGANILWTPQADDTGPQILSTPVQDLGGPKVESYPAEGPEIPDLPGFDAHESGPSILDRSGLWDDARIGYEGKNYIQDMERRSGTEIPKTQRELITRALRDKSFEKVGPDVKAEHKKEYSRERRQMIKDWEKHTGHAWPHHERVNPKTKSVERVPYQLHHIIPQEIGGPNTWWNAHPLRGGKDHQGGVHGKDSHLRNIMKDQK